MKLYKSLACIIMLSLVFVSCKKEDLTGDIPTMGGNPIQPLPMDIWIRDTLNIPFNIAVKYKWDVTELEIYKTLVPPEESAVIPALKAVKKVWIDTYIDEAGADFFRKYCPKQFVLVGSANYETDGNVILGTAEAGRKIVLYDINHLNKTSVASISKMLHVIEHEFAHILHQNVMYPTAYKLISPGYTGTWYNVNVTQARNQGFITPYAMSAPDEDFAEMVSTMLTASPSTYNSMIDMITSADGKKALKAKESMIVSYFNDIYGIDFYSLRNKTVAAMEYVTTH